MDRVELQDWAFHEDKENVEAIESKEENLDEEKILQCSRDLSNEKKKRVRKRGTRCANIHNLRCGSPLSAPTKRKTPDSIL